MKYVSFENNHIEECDSLRKDDALVSWFVDGYPEQEDASGGVVVVVTLTIHGDIVVDWHHNGYRLNTTVLEMIDEIKSELRRSYSKTNMSKYKAYAGR